MDWLGPLCALASSFTWVFGSGAYTALAREHPPERVNFNRALVAMTLFAVAALVRHEQVAASIAAVGEAWPSYVAWLAISIWASYGFGDIFFMRAAPLLGFPATQAVGAVFPIWASLAAWLFLGEHMTPRHVVGMLIAVAGIVGIILGKAKPVEAAPQKHVGRGVALALLCSLFWGVNSYASAQGGRGFDPAFGNFIRMLVATFTCLGLSLRVAPQTVWLKRADYRKFGLIIAGESFLGSMAYVYGLSHSSMAVGATLSSLAPLLSLPLSWALGWEKFAWRPVIGAAVAMAGLWMLVL